MPARVSSKQLTARLPFPLFQVGKLGKGTQSVGGCHFHDDGERVFVEFLLACSTEWPAKVKTHSLACLH